MSLGLKRGIVQLEPHDKQYYHAEDTNGNSLDLRDYENLEILEIRLRVYAP